MKSGEYARAQAARSRPLWRNRFPERRCADKVWRDRGVFQCCAGSRLRFGGCAQGAVESDGNATPDKNGSAVPWGYDNGIHLSKYLDLVQ